MTWCPDPLGHSLSVGSGNTLTGDVLPPLSLKGFEKTNSYKGHGKSSGFICQESIRFLSGLEVNAQTFRGMSLLAMLIPGQDTRPMSRTGTSSCCWHRLQSSIVKALKSSWWQGQQIQDTGYMACIPVYSEPLLWKLLAFSPKPVCDTTQSKAEQRRVYGSRPVWTAALLTFVIMGVSKAWTQTVWQRLKDSESRKRGRSKVKTRSLYRRGGRRLVFQWGGCQTATRLISAKGRISPCGEVKGSEACCWLGNGSGALAHKLSGAKAPSYLMLH